jgi:hypothetical protein
MRIIIEDDYRFVGAAPGLPTSQPHQTAQTGPYQFAQAGSYQTPQAPYLQAAPTTAGHPTNDVRNGGEVASHVRQQVVTHAAADLYGGGNTSTAATQVLETVDIGPAPEWLKRVSVTVKDAGKGPVA